MRGRKSYIVRVLRVEAGGRARSSTWRPSSERFAVEKIGITSVLPILPPLLSLPPRAAPSSYEPPNARTIVCRVNLRGLGIRSEVSHFLIGTRARAGAEGVAPSLRSETGSHEGARAGGGTGARDGATLGNRVSGSSGKFGADHCLRSAKRHEDWSIHPLVSE